MLARQELIQWSLAYNPDILDIYKGDDLLDLRPIEEMHVAIDRIDKRTERMVTMMKEIQGDRFTVTSPASNIASSPVTPSDSEKRKSGYADILASDT